MKPVRFYLTRVGFAAAGIDGWAALRAALGDDRWRDDPDWSAAPVCLSPRAARRLSPQIRLALSVAEQLGPPPPEAGCVFASSVGEGETLKVILDALRTPEMLVQPLRFQNAVHNAAAGQWSIAAGHRGPITSLSAYDETVAAALLKAVMQMALERRPARVVCYDVPLPQPLHPVRPMGIALGAGLALSPVRDETALTAFEASLGDAPPSAAETPLGALFSRSGNPVAQMLPLLERLARGYQGPVTLALNGGRSLTLTLAPP